MLSELLFGLRGAFTGFNVFRYITFRSALAAFSAFLICYFLLPVWIERVGRRGVGQVIRKEGPRSHRAKAGTPTMGGLVVVAAIALCVVLWARPESPFVWLSLASLLWFGGVGLADDWLKVSENHSRGLPAMWKLFWQFLGAFIIGIAYLLLVPGGLEQGRFLSIPFWKHPLAVPVGAYLFVVALVMVGMSNAVNLTDGLDGLAAGLIAMAGAGLIVIAYLAGNLKFSGYLRIPYVPAAGELAVVCAVLVGACLGFLWYNAPPAQVFMGDVGALGMGGLLGAIAVFCRAEVLMLIFGGVFVLEALSVLAQVGSYKLLGRRVLLMAPLHHHFELSGVPETKVIVRFWIFSLLLVLGMLMTLKLR